MSSMLNNMMYCKINKSYIILLCPLVYKYISQVKYSRKLLMIIFIRKSIINKKCIW